MREYHRIVEQVLREGEWKLDKSRDVKVLTHFGDLQAKFDLQRGFPAVTTKKLAWESVVVELLWFLRGDTNIKYLKDNGCNIWDKDALRFQKRIGNLNEAMSLSQYRTMLKSSGTMYFVYGSLGKVYGHQWRDFSGVDQLYNLVQSLRNNPHSRYHIVSAWNPGDQDEMALPPCHLLSQFYVRENKYLDCKMYQRSADMFLGVPFNIASYALLTHIIAIIAGYEPGRFYHTFGDAHIYESHMEAMKEQMGRNPSEYMLPGLSVDQRVLDRAQDFHRKKITFDSFIYDLQPEFFKLVDYKSFPVLKAEMIAKKE